MEELRKKISKLKNNDLKDVIIALFEQIEQLSDDIMRLWILCDYGRTESE